MLLFCVFSDVYSIFYIIIKDFHINIFIFNMLFGFSFFVYVTLCAAMVLCAFRF